jgi:hypothetical protein
MYSNGTKSGFIAFQNVVKAIHSRFRDQTEWMKLSEIARYWAAKEVTEIKATDKGYLIDAPFACPQFTVKLNTNASSPPRIIRMEAQKAVPLQEVQQPRDLKAGTWLKNDEQTIVCFDLQKGSSRLVM